MGRFRPLARWFSSLPNVVGLGQEKCSSQQGVLLLVGLSWGEQSPGV